MRNYVFAALMLSAASAYGQAVTPRARCDNAVSPCDTVAIVADSRVADSRPQSLGTAPRDVHPIEPGHASQPAAVSPALRQLPSLVPTLGPPMSPDSDHPFFDRQNVELHLANIATQTLDAYTTHKFITEHTGREVNPFARLFVYHGWPGQIAYSYGWDVGATLAFSYWLHRHNHHRLERLTPILVGIPTAICGAQNFRLLHPAQLQH